LQDYANAAKDAANNANDAYNDLLSKKSGYEELIDQIKGLTEGTLEYKKALLDIQNMNLEMANEWGNLIEFEEVNGVRTITGESWDRILE
jgi:hypothetical protein